ncbi:hypothetical protein [Runella slithyformis]|uniref:YbbR-like domain-containing protein n=1 Tax=Runella slithyformis (strain ATCC 29530 / DSM 19594 / LMG 11500 / NCIMB 11436 / LSU 4) TaxID=761193 RepID=A0A7U3ZLT3_RUNSL|nr:hypothetical protein [Runella slithyformis]AEI49561.1 hypothetical protein Runsl_3182 [Runella slithyformis DSM 19594]
MAQLPLSSQPSRSRILLLSMVAATIIWLFNELNKEGYTLQVQYPIHLTYNDSLYIPITPLPKSVTATLNGNGWTLLRKSLSFTVSPVQYPITNPLVTRSLNSALLTTLMHEQVKDVRMTNVMLDINSLDFEERMVKTTVLRADSANLDLLPRFVVSSFINLRPSTVTFDGPASLVTDIADTILVRVPAKKIRGNYDEELLIRYPQSPLLKASADRVFVSFEVAELLGSTPPAAPATEEVNLPAAKKEKAEKKKSKKK